MELHVTTGGTMSLESTRQLLASWAVDLRARSVPANTVTAYTAGAGHWLDWVAGENMEPDLTRPDQVRAWLAHLAAAGRKPSTLTLRLVAVRCFAQWLVDEGELTAHGLAKIKCPKRPHEIQPSLSVAQYEAMQATCRGKTFADRRDAAILAMMFESMVRSDELVGMDLCDLNIAARIAVVRRAKGGKERVVPFSTQTAAALNRYLRARAKHSSAGSGALWLSARRGRFTYRGLYEALRRRGAAAGFKFTPHMTRRGGAINWRRKRGSELGLMTLCGWSDIRMARRYTLEAERELALAEAHELFSR